MLGMSGREPHIIYHEKTNFGSSMLIWKNWLA